MLLIKATGDRNSAIWSHGQGLLHASVGSKRLVALR